MKQSHLGRRLIEGYHMTRTGLNPVAPTMQHSDVDAEAARQPRQESPEASLNRFNRSGKSGGNRECSMW